MADVLILKISSDGVPLEHTPTADDITFLSGTFGDLEISLNQIVSLTTNSDLALTPNGTGDLVLDGVNWPQADGAANTILSTDGAGQTSWVTAFAGIVKNSYTADEALTENDFLYISAADNVSKADVSGAGAPSRVMGLAETTVSDTDPVNVISEGVKDGFSALTAGARYYADPGTAGGHTATVPVGTGNTIVQVGYAKSATEMHLHIEQLGRRS